MVTEVIIITQVICGAANDDTFPHLQQSTTIRQREQHSGRYLSFAYPQGSEEILACLKSPKGKQENSQTPSSSRYILERIVLPLEPRVRLLERAKKSEIVAVVDSVGLIILV